jgi:murein DD-endopeptidase MepM/ murein hydrolase activator NlpD
MLKKKLTFLIIPDSQNEPRQVTLRLATIYGIMAGVVISIIGGFFFAGLFVSDQVDQAALDKLKSENERLTGKYEQIRWNLAEVDSRYNDLVQKEIALRTMFDLPEINPQERQLGIGGPGAQSLASMSQTERVAYLTETEVDRLLRLSQFEIEKYNEVEDKLANLDDRLRHTPSIWPTQGWLSRGYGMKYDPFTGYKQMHRGLDLANHHGTTIIAPADGVVRSVGKAGALGKMLVIDHGYGFVTRFGHLSKTTVKRGQRIRRGDPIALMGNTGYSTGPHLHYEVWRNNKALNPMNYILNDQ